MDALLERASQMFADIFTFKVMLGLVGQAMFASRFIVQWIVSERRGESVVPFSFWILSLLGCGLLLVYSILDYDPVILMGMLPGVFIYTRNIVLLRRHGRRLSPGMFHGEKVIDNGGDEK